MSDGIDKGLGMTYFYILQPFEEVYSIAHVYKFNLKAEKFIRCNTALALKYVQVENILSSPALNDYPIHK